MFPEIKGKVQRIIQRNRQIKKNTDELLWAEMYDSAIRGSKWLFSGISPGRWAVGFPYLYVMYRVLDEMRPDMILEIGTGQTTRMISDYLLWNSDAAHIAVEQDEEWAEYIKKNVVMDRSDLIIMPTQLKSDTVNGNNVRMTHYTGFRENIAGSLNKHGSRRISFISLDGPSTLAGQTKGISARRDLLELIPEMMADDFVILIDDIDRDVNRRLAGEIEESFKKAGISTRSGAYWGQKGMAVVASESLKWYTSL